MHRFKIRIKDQMTKFFTIAFLFFSSLAIAQPTITSFSPTSGAVGATVTITGTGFIATPASNIVYFDGVKAAVTSATTTSLSVTVPSGTTSEAEISILKGGLMCISRRKFNITFNSGTWTNFGANDFSTTTIATGGAATGVFNIPFNMIGTGDFDLDGDLDVVQVNQNTTVRVLQNTSTISAVSFSATITSLTASANAQAVLVEDFNNDGLLDIVVGNGSSINIFLNTNSTSGTMSFSAQTTFTIGNSTNMYEAIDINNDGKLDIVSGSGTTVNYIFNTTTAGASTPTFGTINTKDWGAGNNVNFIAKGNFNNDAYLDILVVHQGSKYSTLPGGATNFGTTFNSNTSLTMQGGNTSPSRVSVSDFNNDGVSDFAVWQSGNTMAYFINNGSGVFTSGTTSFSSNSGVGCGPRAMDLNGDALPELMHSDYNSSANFWPHKNTTSGSTVSFATSGSSINGNPAVTTWNYGDINGDGKVDILAMTFWNSSLYVSMNKIGPVPSTITVSGTLNPFTKCSGIASTPQSFSVSGTNMAAGISIAALIGFEYCLTSNGTYTSTLTVGASGTIASTNVFVRMQSTANNATYTAANIALSSTNATSQNISASGTVNALPTVTGILSLTTNTSQLTGSGTAAASNPWVSSNTAVATVSNTGLVTPISTGSSTITYTNSLGCSITASVTVTMSTITTSVNTLTAFSSCPNIESTTQTFTVSGTNLSANISITAPTGFEISTAATSGFSSTLTLTQSAGSVSSTTLYARMGAFSSSPSAGNISLTTTNATNKTIAVSGVISGGGNSFGNALDFAAGQYVSCGTSAYSTITYPFTVEAWVYFKGGNSINAIINKASDGGGLNGGFGLYINSWNTQDRRLIFQTNGTALSTPDNSMPLNTWTHVAATVTSATAGQLFINGVAQTVVGSVNYGANTVTDFTLGSITAAYKFNGTIDDVRIWSASKTASQILSAMNSELAGSETNLIGYFNCNQGIAAGNNTSISTLTNSVSGAPSGTLISFTRTGSTSNFVGGQNYGTAVVGGSIAGSATVCTGTNSTLLTLSGHTGTIIKWQSSTSSTFASAITDISNTTTTHTASNLSTTTYYRALLLNTCQAYSTIATVTVNPASVSGSITGAATVCSGTNSTLLTLSGNTGNVTRWESSLDNFATAGTAISNTNLTQTATNLSTTTYYRAVVTSGSCAAANSASAAVSVNSSLGGTVAGTTTVCAGNNSTLTLSGHSGSIQWQSSIDNSVFNNISLQTSTTYTATNLLATTYYRAVVTNGSCAPANSSTATLTVNSNNTWTGTSNNSWNTAANWSCGVVPTVNHNVIISSGNPVMDVDFTNPSGKTFTISGSGTLTINDGKTLTIAGTTDFGGKSITLKSTSTGTAAIGTITGTLSNATNVTVERYIAGAGRRYRFLASPVQSKTIANWMTQFYVTGPCTTAPTVLGAINDQGWHSNWANITAPGAYNASTNPRAEKYTSIRTYDETVSGSLNLGFTDVTTGTALSAGKGFKTYIRGAIGNTGQLNGTVTGQTTVTLSLNGTINQGEVNANPTRSGTSLVDDGWNLLGNPYPSAYNFYAQYLASSSANIANIIPTVYVYSAITGGYVSHNASSNLTSGLVGGIIPSGSGFFVQASAANPVFKFVEAYKTSVNPSSLHKNEIKTDEFGIKYFKDSSESDYLVVKMLAGATLNNEMYDIKKFRNDNLNLAAYGQDSIDLAGSCIPLVNGETRINLNIEANAVGNYQFEFTNLNNFDANVAVSLLDKFTNKTSNVKANSKYTFELGAGVNQWGKNRFELILNGKASTGIKQSEAVLSANLLVYPNPATNFLNINISNANFKNSNVVIYNVSGQQLMNSTMNGSNTQLNIEALSNGVYFVNVNNENGFNKTVKFVK